MITVNGHFYELNTFNGENPREVICRLYTNYTTTDGKCVLLYYSMYGAIDLELKLRGEDLVERTLFRKDVFAFQPLPGKRIKPMVTHIYRQYQCYPLMTDITISKGSQSFTFIYVIWICLIETITTGHTHFPFIANVPYHRWSCIGYIIEYHYSVQRSVVKNVHMFQM